MRVVAGQAGRQAGRQADRRGRVRAANEGESRLEVKSRQDRIGEAGRQAMC